MTARPEKDPMNTPSPFTKLTTYLADNCAEELASALDHNRDVVDVAIDIMRNADNAIDDLEKQLNRETGRADRLFRQIAKLGDHLMAELPGEPRPGEGAIDCAIRIMKELQAWQNNAAHQLINLHLEVENAKQAGRLEVARDIRNMGRELGDEGWSELERRADAAEWPRSYLREMRNDDHGFATCTVEAAYQSTRDRCATIAEGAHRA